MKRGFQAAMFWLIFKISFEGDPVIITVGLWVLSIDSINVVDMVRMFFFFFF